MRLSVFAGGWTLEEAAPVTGATLAALAGVGGQIAGAREWAESF